VAGETAAWPKPVAPEEVWLEGDAVVVLVETDAAAVAGWLERARPTVAAKASTAAKAIPRLASAARRRAILIGTAGIECHGITTA
jgi:hypothetical protein